MEEQKSKTAPDRANPLEVNTQVPQCRPGTDTVDTVDQQPATDGWGDAVDQKPTTDGRGSPNPDQTSKTLDVWS